MNTIHKRKKKRKRMKMKKTKENENEKKTKENKNEENGREWKWKKRKRMKIEGRNLWELKYETYEIEKRKEKNEKTKHGVDAQSMATTTLFIKLDSCCDHNKQHF